MLAKFLGGPHDGLEYEYQIPVEDIAGIEFGDGAVYLKDRIEGETIVLQFAYTLKEKFARRNADREPVSYEGEGVGTESPRNN